MRAFQWYLSAAVFCLLTITGCGKQSDNSIPTTEKQETPKTETDIIRVTGEQLTADYKMSKEEANKKYRRKKLEIEAVVDQIYRRAGTVSFKSTPEMNLQSNEFGPEELEKHKEIIPGTILVLHAQIGIVFQNIVNLDSPKIITIKPAAPSTVVTPKGQDAINQAEEAAAAAVKKLRGFTEGSPVTLVSLMNRNTDDDALQVLKPLTKVETLYLSGTKVSNVGLKHLTHMTNLKVLYLADTQVDDNGLKQLATFKALESLHVGPEISSDGLKNLTAIKSLRSLDLTRSKEVTDAGLMHLTGMKDLRSLTLAYTGVTEAGLHSISDLSALEKLDLGGLKVTDLGLKQLATLKSLKDLCLINTSITDAGMEHLRAFQALKKLNLINTKITDAGLSKLVSLANLVELELNDTMVTNKGVEAFRKALPKCRIER